MTKEKKICPCCKTEYDEIPDGSLCKLGRNLAGQTIMTEFLQCFTCWNQEETEDEPEWEGQSAVEPIMQEIIDSHSKIKGKTVIGFVKTDFDYDDRINRTYLGTDHIYDLFDAFIGKKIKLTIEVLDLILGQPESGGIGGSLAEANRVFQNKRLLQTQEAFATEYKKLLVSYKFFTQEEADQMEIVFQPLEFRPKGDADIK